MRHPHSTHPTADVSGPVVDTLTRALGWLAATPAVAPGLLIRLLVRAAAAMRSLSAIVPEAAGPGPEAVRRALRAALPADPDDLLPPLRAALHDRLPKALA